MKRIIVDSSSLIYAAFYTTGSLSYDGKDTGIIYGFLRKILKIGEKFQTNKFYFCFDHKINYRERIYPEYKANRNNRKKEMTSIEKQQKQSRIKQADELRTKTLYKLGFKNIYRQEGYESDDLIAVLAKKLKYAHIVTEDNDLFQCLEYSKIINPKTLKVFTQKHFEEKYKVHPSQWPICKSIGGCSGDNVIGIQGASDPKNPSSQAIKYVCGKLSKGKLLDRIKSKEGKAIIERNAQLVTLPFDPDNINKMKTKKNSFNKAKFIKVFSKYNFRSFLEKGEFEKWEKIFLKD